MNGLHRFVVNVSRVMALLGGAVLVSVILITCVSIVGRALNSLFHVAVQAGIAADLAQGLIDAGVGAIPGSFELVEAAMAFCIFAFLPYCQVTQGHASVDLLANAMPRPVKRSLDVMIAALFAAVLVLIAVQLYAGFERKHSSGQTSLMLQFPVWWAYGASLFGAFVAAAAAVYVAWIKLYETLTGRVVMPDALGADH